MLDESAPKTPAAQKLYGEVVYWVTIVSALMCMVGPVIAMLSPGDNLLNPHYVFANIFNGERPMSIWALSAAEEVRLPAFTQGMSEDGRADGSSDRREYSELSARDAVGLLESLPRWSGMPAEGASPPTLGFPEGICVARLSDEEAGGGDADEKDRESFLLAGAGGEARACTLEKARDEVLRVYGEAVFTNGHFWLDDLSSGDGFTQLGLALGCSVALWALIGAALAYFRDRNFLYVGLALWVAMLVLLSATGLVSQGH